MATLSVSSLSCDYTFKISRNVGLVRETDNTFVTQFNQLFISLNEIGQVVAWRLIKSTTFSEIEDLLVDLHKSNSLAGNTVDLVCVDDCSCVRNKHTNIFPNVVVKLDLFHACQRVPKTFLRQHSLYKDFVQIKYVAQSTTKGKHAYKRTRPKQKIEKNLNSFIDRQSNVPENYLSEATLQEMSHIRQHVQKGCLSDIPPGCGTKRNEGLHRLLNRSRISGAPKWRLHAKLHKFR